MKIKLKDADEFSEILIRKGLSKRAFAETAGIGQVTAQQICSGDRRPSPAVAKKISDALNIPFDELFVIEKNVPVLSVT